jgi:drug/metabolite transporter (DMT)-like permease
MKNVPLRKIDIPAMLVLLGITLTWSTGPLFVRQFYREGLAVWDMNLFRYVMAVSLLWLTVVVKHYARRGGGETAMATGRLWRRALMPALPALGTQVFFSWSVYYLQPGLVGILHKQCVIWAVLFAMCFFADERSLLRSGRFWIGSLCGLAGVVGVVALREDVTWEGEWLGVLFIFIFSVCWGFYGVMIRRFTRHIDPVRGCTVVMTYMAAAILVLSLFLGEPHTFRQIPARLWCMLFLSSAIHLYLPYMGMYWVITHIGVTITNTTLLLTAFLTPLFSWLIFSEQLTVGQWGSGVILVFGAGLTMMTEQKIHEPELLIVPE